MLRAEQLENRLVLNAYFVSPYGDDLADGLTPETAWQSTERANVLDLEPGDILAFEGGQSFPGRLQLGPEDSGAEGNGVLIGSYGEGRAMLAGLDSTNQEWVHVTSLVFAGPGRYDTGPHTGVAFSANDGRLLRGVSVDGIEAYDWPTFGLYFGGDAPNSGYEGASLTNSVFHATRNTGVMMYGYQNGITNTGFYVAGVEVYDTTILGIYISGVAAATVEYSYVHDVGSDYNWVTAGGPAGFITAWADSVLFQYNTAINIFRGAAVFDGDGFDFDHSTTNSIMQFNYAANCDGAGFMVYSGFGSNWNNAIYHNVGVNLALNNLGGIFLGGNSFNTWVAENEIYVWAAGPAILLWPGVTGIIDQNVFYVEAWMAHVHDQSGQVWFGTNYYYYW